MHRHHLHSHHLVDEAASRFCFEGFLEQLILHAHIRIHLLEPAILLSHVLHLFDERRVHTVKFGTSFAKAVTTHPVFSGKLRDRHAALRLLQHSHDLRIAKSSVLHPKSAQIS